MGARAAREFRFRGRRSRFHHCFILVPMATTIKMVDPAENEFLASLESKAKQPNPFFRTMANRPEVLKTFVPFYGAVVGPGSVDRRIKRLVYLTCSYANECAYCTAAHMPSGRKAGITEDEMQRAPDGAGRRLLRSRSAPPSATPAN